MVGATVLVVAALAYYVGIVVMWPGRLLVSALIVWVAVAPIGGTVFGAAGAAWNSSREGRFGPRLASLSVGLLVGALMAEGLKAQLFEATTLVERLLFALEPATAVALPFALLRTAEQRREAYVAALVLSVLGFVALVVGLPLVRAVIAL